MAFLSGACGCQRAMVARVMSPSRRNWHRLPFVILFLLGAGITMGQTQPLGRLRGDQAEVFNDGKTLVVFAYQNDELLWMEPFLSVARKIVVAGYPPSETHRAAVAKMPSHYKEAWTPLWNKQKLTDRDFVKGWQDCQFSWGWINPSTLKVRLREFVADPETKRVVTHSPWGEYGHPALRWVYEALRDLTVEMRKDLWCLGVSGARAEPGKDLEVDLYYRKELATSIPFPFIYREHRNTGLPMIEGYFDPFAFEMMRKNYESTSFSLTIYCISKPDSWIWWTGEESHLRGWKPFLKMVDRGRDLGAENPVVKNLVVHTRWNRCHLHPRYDAITGKPEPW